MMATQRNYAGRSADERTSERRKRLLAAALELYGTVGYAATSVDQLCALASVSTRSFYQEKGSREKLLIAAAEDITSRAHAAATATLMGLPDAQLPERISQSFRAFLAVTCADPRTARICYIEVVGVSPEVEKWRIASRDRIAAVMVSEAQRAGALGQARLRDYRLLSVGIIGAVNALAQEFALTAQQGERALTLERLCNEVVDLAYDALALRTEHPEERQSVASDVPSGADHSR